MPKLRTLLFQLHWILGITVGLMLAVIGVTGATMAFEDQIMAALSPGIVDVAPRAAPTLSPDQLLARFAAQRAGTTATSLTLRNAAGASPQVTFTEAAGKGAKKLYLDPYDGHVLGRATGEDFFATVRKLHRYLLLPGDAEGIGRQITGVVAFSLIFFAVSGLYLRWPKRPQSWKYWLKPNLRLRKRGLYWSLHTVVGTWLALIYLVIAAMGLTWSYSWYKDGLTRVLTGTVAEDGDDAPKGKSSPKGASSGVKAAPQVDVAWQAIQRAPGGARLAVLSIPKSAKGWIRVRYLSQDAPNERAFTEVQIDTKSGAVLKRDAYGDHTLGERIMAERLAVHRGSFFGLPGAILFALAAAAMPLFPITGWLLYLGRRRLKRNARLRPMRSSGV